MAALLPAPDLPLHCADRRDGTLPDIRRRCVGAFLVGLMIWIAATIHRSTVQAIFKGSTLGTAGRAT